MPSLRVLTVCTGNTCRSPMAASLLAVRLADAGLDAVVVSAGTLGWRGRPATDHAVAVMAEYGLDLSAHRSRRLEPADLDVDLVVAMTRVHAGAVVARDAELAPRVFLPGEYARLHSGGPGRGTGESWADHIAAVGGRRTGVVPGRPHEEVADPAGEPADVYRATAARLDRDLTRLVDALTGATRRGLPPPGGAGQSGEGARGW